MLFNFSKISSEVYESKSRKNPAPNNRGTLGLLELFFWLETYSWLSRIGARLNFLLFIQYKCGWRIQFWSTLIDCSSGIFRFQEIKRNWGPNFLILIPGFSDGSWVQTCPYFPYKAREGNTGTFLFLKREKAASKHKYLLSPAFKFSPFLKKINNNLYIYLYT